MAGIFTRPAISAILADENLTADERLDRIMSLRGRDLDDGYITKSAAKAAQDTALEQAKADWEKNLPKPNVKESDEYKALAGEFDSYKTMQAARTSDDFAGVKPKFFDTVYGMIDRKDGAKSVKEQLEALKKDYEEYFTPSDPATGKPQFGASTRGSMPTGEQGAVAEFSKAWGYHPQKG